MTWNYQPESILILTYSQTWYSLMTVELRPNYHRVRKIACGTKPRALDKSQPSCFLISSPLTFNPFPLWPFSSSHHSESRGLRKNNHPKMVLIIGTVMVVELGDDIILGVLSAYFYIYWRVALRVSHLRLQGPTPFNPVIIHMHLTWYPSQSWCWYHEIRNQQSTTGRQTDVRGKDIKRRFVAAGCVPQVQSSINDNCIIWWSCFYLSWVYDNWDSIKTFLTK